MTTLEGDMAPTSLSRCARLGLTKIEWKEWIQKMLDAHGPSTKDAPKTATEDVNQADLRVEREQVNQEDPTRE